MRTYHYDLQLSHLRFREKKNRRKLLIGVLVWCICIWALLHRMYGVSVVSGNSMRPSFCSGDIVLYRRGLPKEPAYGDVLIIRSWLDGEKDYLKRIAGLPGDVVEVDDKGYLIRNGGEVKEHEVLHGYQQPDAYVSMPYEVPEDTYFCLGDNRPVSLDSRAFGAATRKQVLGNVVAVLRFGV